MDKLAQRLSDFFGSSPFILFHLLWFSIWIGFHYAANFDSDWNLLTLIVSLEAIFLALFILRAETVQSRRQEAALKRDLAKSDKIIEKLEEGQDG